MKFTLEIPLPPVQDAFNEDDIRVLTAIRHNDTGNVVSASAIDP